MFKRLKEKIVEEVKQAPIRFPQFPGQDLINFGESNGQSPQQSGTASGSQPASHASADQFSITEDDDDALSSGANTPLKKKDALGFEEVSFSDDRAGPSPPRTSFGDRDGAAILPLYRSPEGPQYVPQSDIESEVEEAHQGIDLDAVSKEQLFAAFQKTHARVHKYKGKYAEVVKAYRALDSEKEKIKKILTESQDKALRRIGELREQAQLEQQAKAHLEENLRCILEEKEEMIKVLETKVNLLKAGVNATDRVENIPDVAVSGGGGLLSSPTARDEDAAHYKEKVRRLEALISKCKDTIKNNRERTTQLIQEKDSLTKALELRTTELQQVQEKEAEVQAGLRNELLSLREEAEESKRRQEETAMAMAETKRNMHEELELKETLLAQAQGALQSTQDAAEALRTQLEESRAALAQKEREHEESRSSLEQQLTSLERTLEEERKTSLQELSRGKAAALSLMKQECEKKIQAAEHNWVQKLEASEKEYHRRISEKENELCKVAKKLSELNSITEESEEQVNSSEDLAATPESQRDSLLADIEQYKNVKVKLEQTVKELKEELEDARTRLQGEVEAAVERTVQEWELKTRELISQHQAELSAVRAEADEVTRSKSEQSNEVAVLRQQLESLAASHAEAIQDLRRKLEEESQQLLVAAAERHAKEVSDAAKHTEETLTPVIKDLQTKLEKALQETMQKGEDNAKLVNCHREEMEATMCKLQEVQQKEAQLSSHLASLQEKADQEKVKISEQCRALQIDLSETRLLLEQKEAEFEAERTNHNSSLSQLSEQLREAKKKSQDLEKEIYSMRATTTDSQDVAERHQKELQDLRDILEKEKSRLEKQIEELKEEADRREETLHAETEGSQRLHLRISELETEGNSLLEKHASATEECRQLSSRLKEQGELLAEAENEVDRSRKALNTEAKNVELLNTRVAELEAHKSLIEAQLSSLLKHSDDLSSQLKTKDQLLADTATRAEESQKALSAEEAKAERLGARITELEEQNSSVLEQHRSITEQLNQLSSKLKTKEDSLAESEQRAEQLDVELRTLRAEQLVLSEQAQTLKGSREAVLKEREELENSIRGEVETLRQEKKELEDRLAALEGDKCAAEQVRDNLYSNHALLQMEFQELSSTSRVQKEYLAELRNELEMAQSEREALESSVESLAGSERNLNQRNESLEKELHTATATLNELKRLLSAAEEERDSLAVEYSAARDQLRAMQVTQEEQLVEMFKERETFQRALGDLEALHGGVLKEKGAAEALLEELRSRLSQDEAGLETRRKEEEDARREERERLEAEVKQLREELAMKMEEILSTKEALSTLQSDHKVQVDSLQERIQNLESSYLTQLSETNAGTEQQLAEMARAFEDKATALQSEWALQRQGYASEIEQLKEELHIRTTQLDESLLVAEQRASTVSVQLQETLRKMAEVEEDRLRLVDRERSLEAASEEADARVRRLEAANEEARQRVLDLEAAIVDKEEKLLSEMKQAAHSFSAQMEETEAEHRQSVSDTIADRAEQLENRLAAEHQRDMEAMETEMAEKVAALEEVHKHYQGILRKKEEEFKALQREVGQAPAVDGVEHSGWDEEWAKVDEEEWNLSSADHSPTHKTAPRNVADKCLQHTQQIEALKSAVGKYQDEINDLRCILGSRQNNNANLTEKNSVKLPEPTEYEYLRNILFEYMMGKETVTLSKVIAAVLKFSDEQKTLISQREEAKQVQALQWHPRLSSSNVQKV
ncbi:golgin subfamily A member 4 isoform X3 [Ixodes scapularis]|uniref:golgin subfamily A member 4 isoform X3 n=1 Tax=Ixodes scapularis TaxID=6945 RepID=UPI001A9D00F4|nr:golgin subfamily A member 4 isoform X3 [Ixodes scapularis]